jgi:hypothetical protein
MQIVPVIAIVVAAAIWIAVLLTVLARGLGSGMDVWIRLGALTALPLVAIWSYLRLCAQRRRLD